MEKKLLVVLLVYQKKLNSKGKASKKLDRLYYIGVMNLIELIILNKLLLN